MATPITKRLDSKCEDIKRLIFQVKHSNGVQFRMLEEKIQSDLEDIKIEFDNLLHNTMSDYVMVTKEEYDKLMLAKKYLETDMYDDRR